MLEIRHIYKQYEGIPLLEDISFSIAANETVCLLGPSGSGKSTILRIIAGLDSVEKGKVFWSGKNLNRTPAHQRGFGLMFQDYALFPHLNVFENIAFGLRQQKWEERGISSRVAEVLDLVKMADFGGRSVIDLSGGEKQRVAYARAIAPRPHLLMLDEPMGSLDRALRDQLLTDLQDLLRVTDIPVIYVTHDQDEAFSIADRILVLHQGQIVQAGIPAEVYKNPKNSWIASFFGFQNRLHGNVVSRDPLIVQTVVGNIHVKCGNPEMDKGAMVELIFLTSKLVDSPTDDPNQLKGKVKTSQFGGDDYQAQVFLENGTVFTISTNKESDQGENVVIVTDPTGIMCFKEGE